MYFPFKKKKKKTLKKQLTMALWFWF